MSEIIWPAGENANILLLLDAAHEVEEELLQEFVAQQYKKSGYPGELHCVTLPISRNQLHNC